MTKKTELLLGTPDMLILRTLERGPLHGYGIALSIRRVSEEVLRVEEGSLYPACNGCCWRGEGGARIFPNPWGDSDCWPRFSCR